MSSVNIQDEIKKLIELQAIDAEIYRIRKDLDAMPIKLREFDDIIKDKESIYKTSEEKLKKLQLKRKEKEVDLQAKEEAIKKHQTQLFQIKTNKEYQAMEKEIASLKADDSLIEEEIINIFDEIESAEKELQDNKKKFEQEKTLIEAERKKMESEKSTIEEELKKYETQRAEFIKNIDRNVLSRYEKILLGKDGLALVPIAGDACGGCNMNLPPQVINETKLKTRLIFCGSCSRILYSQE